MSAAAPQLAQDRGVLVVLLCVCAECRIAEHIAEERRQVKGSVKLVQKDSAAAERTTHPREGRYRSLDEPLFRRLRRLQRHQKASGGGL